MEVSYFILIIYFIIDLLLFLFNSVIIKIIKIVPYGWKNPSHYEIEQIDGPDSTEYIDIEGTLIASPYLSHLICLSNGTYIVTLDEVPESDDILVNETERAKYGVEEYRIFFNLNFLQIFIYYVNRETIVFYKCYQWKNLSYLTKR